MPLLEQITTLWLNQIEAAEEQKEEQFGKAARQAWKYLGRDYRPLYYESDDEHEFPDAEQGLAKPIIVGKSAEFVALMLPYIHAKVPHRLVDPSRPSLPDELLASLLSTVPANEQEETSEAVIKNRFATDAEDKLRAWLMQFWLNYISHEGYDLASEARSALTEVLVKGVCVVWTDVDDGPYGDMPITRYGTIDDLLVDPDSETWRDAAYIVRKRRMSLWKIADKFGIDREELRGSHESNRHNAVNTTRNDTSTSQEGDVGEYYEIWSNIGVGDRLVGASDELKEARAALDAVGDHVLLAVMRGVDHPLNLPPHTMEIADPDELLATLKEKLQWPIKFYEEVSDPFPCSVARFYPNAHDPWAQSPLAGGLQCQIFLDKVYYYLMRRVRTSCRDIIVTSKALQESVKDAVESGLDLQMVDYDGNIGDDLSKVIQILEFPQVNKDMWPTIQLIERQFERATGMTPELSGAQPSATSRSATDSAAREGHMTSRADDFADEVEKWMSRIAAKEAFATRQHIRAPNALFGEPDRINGPNGPMWPPASILSQKWDKLVVTEDPVLAASELSYTVEAGSGRRRNKQKQQADVAQLVQVLFPSALQYGLATGNFKPTNELVNMVTEASDIPFSQVFFPDIAMEAVPPEENTGTK